jgi:hypothetical protein
MVNLGAADAVDTKDVAAEQSYNREQVQEQEQVRLTCVCGGDVDACLWTDKIETWGRLLRRRPLTVDPTLRMTALLPTVLDSCMCISRAVLHCMLYHRNKSRNKSRRRRKKRRKRRYPTRRLYILMTHGACSIVHCTRCFPCIASPLPGLYTDT